MSAISIDLPRNIYEDDFHNFILLISEGNNYKLIHLKFDRVKIYIPSAISFLVIKVQDWINQKKEVRFHNYKTCSAFTYLQRIDFFKYSGLRLKENFIRGESRGKFVPLTAIRGDIGELSTNVAECIYPEMAENFNPDETGFFNCLEYAISELANNTVQHARSTLSYMMAQYYPSTNLIRVTIIDNGIGIKKSFIESNVHINEENTHLEAVKKSLEVTVSSKSHLQIWGESVNAGVGLSLLHELAIKTNGHFMLVSGNAYYSLDNDDLFNEDLEFQGTLCTFTFKRSKIKNFHNLLYNIKNDLNLLGQKNKYEELFI